MPLEMKSLFSRLEKLKYIVNIKKICCIILRVVLNVAAFGERVVNFIAKSFFMTI